MNGTVTGLANALWTSAEVRPRASRPSVEGFRVASAP